MKAVRLFGMGSSIRGEAEALLNTAEPDSKTPHPFHGYTLTRT
jgi:hypothetical protein